MGPNKHDHIRDAIEEIDRCLERPPITIEESLVQAVQRGTMTEAEATECLDAYERALHSNE